MRNRLRQILAPTVTMLLILQSLMPGVWAENEAMVQNAEVTTATEVTEEAPVVPAEEPVVDPPGQPEPPAEPEPPTEPEAPEQPEEPEVPEAPEQPEEPTEPEAPQEPEPAPTPIPVWLDNPVQTEATYKNATCDTPPFLNLQPLRDHWAVQKVEISDEWGNVNHNWVLEHAAGTTFWVKVTFIENHVLDVNSYWEWNAGPAKNEALIMIQFAPAPTDADCTTYLTLPAPTATTEDDKSEVDVKAIEAIDGVSSVNIEGDVVAGNDVTVRVGFDHRYNVDPATSTGWQPQADGSATYALTIPAADDADADEGNTETDGATEDGESEGEGSSEEGDLSEGDSEESQSGEESTPGAEIGNEQNGTPEAPEAEIAGTPTPEIVATPGAEELNLVTLPAPEAIANEESGEKTDVNVEVIEAVPGVELVTVEKVEEEPATQGPSLMSARTASAPVDEEEVLEIEVTFEEGATLDEENSSDEWTLSDDGGSAFALLSLGGFAPTAINPDASGITGFTITETEIDDFSESVAFTFDYNLVAPAPTGELAVGDEIQFTLEGYDRLDLDQTGSMAIPLVDDVLGIIIGYVEINPDGTGRLYLTEQSGPGDAAIGAPSYSGTFGFELTSEWAEEYADTEEKTPLDFRVVQEGKTPIEGTLTIPAVPEEEPDPTPEPGENPYKNGWFTNREQGRFNPDGAITWEIRVPTGPASKAILTDNTLVNTGADWEAICEDGTLSWEAVNVATSDVTVTCEDGVITAEFGPYTQENPDQTPGIRFTANITDEENAGNPSDGSLTFHNVVSSEVWGWDADEGDDPLHEGEDDHSITQHGTGPGIGGTANPVKWGSFTRDDQGTETAERAIKWTMRAPAGPAEAVRLIDEVPEGENWTFVCAEGSITPVGIGGTLGSAEWEVIECSPTRVVVEFSAYREFDIYNTPGFEILATIHDSDWVDDRDGRLFLNEVDSELIPWGTDVNEDWDENPIVEGWDDAGVEQNEPPFPNVDPVKDGNFTGRDNGLYISEGAIEWVITLPAGPNGGLELTDTAPADGSWIFDCDTLTPNPEDVGATYECSTTELKIVYADGYESGSPVFSIKADIVAEFEVGQELTNTVYTRVADHLEDNEYGDEDGWLHGEDSHTVTQRLFQFGTGQRGERGEFPVSIGDRVWFDADRNGLQSDDHDVEFGIPGVRVTLFELDPETNDWVQFGETISTDDDGYYWFTGLASDGEYYLQFDRPNALPDGRPLSGWTIKGGGDEHDIQPPAAGTTGYLDSNVDPDTGLVYFTAPTMGANEGGPNATDNPTLDAGVVLPLVSMGNYVWLDNDREGDQDDDEPGVDGVTVNLLDASGNPVLGSDGQPRTTQTSNGGYYVFTDLEPNTSYQVQFIKPAGTNWTSQGNADDMENDNDSNVDPATGIASFTTPASGSNSSNPGEADRPTIDAGLIPVVSVGDRVWIDTNADGLQDGENTFYDGINVLLYKDGVVVDTDVTSGGGYYSFTDLIPGEEYEIRFGSAPEGYVWTKQGGGDLVPNDSNVDPRGNTGIFTAPPYEAGVTQNLGTPENADNPTIDAGLVKVVSIGNWVWIDENRNGEQDSGEPGLDGVRVLLESVGIEAGDPGYKSQTTWTQDGGFYSFNNLLPGADYKLTFFLPDTGQGEPAWAWTVQNATENEADYDDDNDSDVNPADGTIEFTAPLEGSNSLDPLLVDNPTLDGGVIAAVSVGDYVWIDWDREGDQNEAPEDGVAGVRVIITNTDGNDPRTPPDAYTDANGYYYFQELVPGAQYDLQFILPDDGVPVDGENYLGWEWTQQGEGDTTVVPNDSDVDAEGKLSFTAPTSGFNNIGVDLTDNPNLDAGIRPLVSIGDRVWIDYDREGDQDADEPGIEGVEVRLFLDGELVGTEYTDANGDYFFTDLLPEREYEIQFVIPADGLVVNGETYTGWEFTSSAGSEVDASGSDSDANQETGWTLPFTTPRVGNNLAQYDESDIPTIDAGIRPLVSMGDYVWIDWNRDGVQDGDEPGVEGVRVTLHRTDGENAGEFGSTITDADGGYSFVDLDPLGTYRVQFELPETVLGSEAWYFTMSEGEILAGDNSDASADRASEEYSWTGEFGLPEHGNNLDHNTGDGVDRPEIDAGIVPLVSMGDYVWIDWNRNGVQDGDESGVEGVRVTLHRTDGENAGEIGSTITDADGGYSFVDLDPLGTYRVQFELPETVLGSEAWYFTTSEGEILASDNSDANADRASEEYGWTGEFGLPEHGDNLDHESDTGVDRPEIDAGIIPLVSIGDRVWIDYSRDGLQGDHTEEPGVEGVTVILYDGDVNEVKRTTTDGDGVYFFDDLDPTLDYQIQFVLPTDGDGNIDVLGYQGWNFTINEGEILDPSNSDADSLGWTAVFNTPQHGDNLTEYDATDVPEIDGGIIPVVSVGDFVWDDENRDGVQDPGEPGVPGVTVIIYGPDGEEVDRTTTDENGYYSFKDLIPETEYELEFQKPDGYADWTEQGVGEDDSVDSNVDPNGRTSVTTPEYGDNRTEPNAADDPTIDAGLIRLISVGDYVWYDYNRDGIQDADETPIAGVTVTITGPEGFEATTTTDENGYYEFLNLIPETEYTITFEKPEGYTEWTVQGAGEDAAVDSNVDPGGNYTFTTPKHGNNESGPDNTDDPTIDAGLVIKVSVGDYVWYDVDRDGVQDPGEPGVPGVTVIIYGPDGEEVGRTTTDENGYYSFPDLYPNTEYEIEFQKPDGFTEWTTPNAGDDATDSDVNASGRVKFTTPESGENLTTPGNADDPTLDAGLLKLISVGDYVWYDYNRDGVQGADETPIAGVTVTITGPDGFTATTTTDENGYYYFQNLIPETEYTITFELPEGFTQWTTQAAGDDAAVDSNVDANGTYTFTTPAQGNNLIGPGEADDPTIDAGVVKLISVGDYVWYDSNKNGIQDPDEDPAPGIVVHLYQGEKLVGTTVTDENGYYYFQDLFPDTQYTLVFEKPEGYNWTTPGQGSDRGKDSDLNVFGVVTFTTPSSGQNLIGPDLADNPTLDGGLVEIDPENPVDPATPVPTDPDKKPDPVTKLPSTGSGSESSALGLMLATVAGLMAAAVALRLNAYKRS